MYLKGAPDLEAPLKNNSSDHFLGVFMCTEVRGKSPYICTDSLASILWIRQEKEYPVLSSFLRSGPHPDLNILI